MTDYTSQVRAARRRLSEAAAHLAHCEEQLESAECEHAAAAMALDEIEHTAVGEQEHGR